MDRSGSPDMSLLLRQALAALETAHAELAALAAEEAGVRACCLRLEARLVQLQRELGALLPKPPAAGT